jgi:hypothetical protein
MRYVRRSSTSPTEHGQVGPCGRWSVEPARVSYGRVFDPDGAPEYRAFTENDRLQGQSRRCGPV